MYMSQQQNAGKNHNIKIDKKSFDNVAKLIFLHFLKFFLRLYRVSRYYQSLLFTNECTSDCLKKKKTILKFTLK